MEYVVKILSKILFCEAVWLFTKLPSYKGLLYFDAPLYNVC